ncbi:MAG: DUF1122 family protein [Chloroflexi bacterium]|nr:DUF1122 family protein [Chloroflexota bacterium]
MTSPTDPLDSLLADIQPQDRARIEDLLSRKWSLPGEHPVSALDGLALGDCRTVAILGPKNAVGSRYFQLFLADSAGRLADGALALGLHNSGAYPGFNWIEMIQYNEQPTFTPESSSPLPRSGEGRGVRVSLWDSGLDKPLFQALSGLVPAGGHLMVEYDSPGHRATERILALRYPVAASPIGFRMFGAGVRSYRDWYIAEGGREGPRKLQGFKPLNAEIAAEKTAALRAELEEMLASPLDDGHGQWGQLARTLGRRVLDNLPHT